MHLIVVYNYNKSNMIGKISPSGGRQGQMTSEPSIFHMNTKPSTTSIDEQVESEKPRDKNNRKRRSGLLVNTGEVGVGSMAPCFELE